MTGKIKKVSRPDKEHLSSFKKELAIIDKETWEKAQKRWKELEGTWPIRKKDRKAGVKQKSYIHGNPSHLLAGSMKCNSCGGAIVLISGKGSGYYGCYNAKRKTCNNHLLVPRKRVEQTIISELKERILTAENLKYIYKKVEILISKGLNEVPELIKKKKAQREKLVSEIQNYLNYIKRGNLSKAVSDALNEAEKRGENLKQELGSLEFQKENSFKAPPKEWIDHRLGRLRETLSKNTVTSALALKELLGPIRLELIMDEKDDFYQLMEKNFKEDEIASPPTGARNDKIGHTEVCPTMPTLPSKFKPYYVAHTKIQTLALLDEKHQGSNWLHWRRGWDSNPRDSNESSGFQDRPVITTSVPLRYILPSGSQ